MVVVVVRIVSDVAFYIVLIHARVLKFCILSYNVNSPLKLKVDIEWTFLFVFCIPVYHDHMTHIRSLSNWSVM
jgi:hypothetical protein